MSRCNDRNKPAELLGLVRGDAAKAEWTLECAAVEAVSGFDLTGPDVTGPPMGDSSISRGA